MKIKLIIIGKTKSEFLIAGENEYVKRLKHYCNFSELIIPDIKNGGKLSKKELKEKEGNQILASIKNSDYVILLDDKGEMYSSIQFSKYLQKKMNSGLKQLVLVIGGPYGFSEEDV